ncbi:hypothetical protein L3049_17950 [Labilibaculum sp. DW002]|uniref:Prealbumin-like fold domain-containing protein n=1 Tax=Paralabilibaculum antarcticum TaxID=2912572 RepID=A0ABT5VZ88_9BACT|nr:hypothetical protein [Labilibaculum sp. DW002]MDE5419878.1 hypothetical protein [Labilibaculum sp. DW002]
MKKIVIALIALIAFSACEKTNYVDSPPQLQFTVLDENGVLVEDASVTLFTTYDAWYNIEDSEENMIATTDSTGTCLFTDLQEVYYFFNVEKGEELTNSTSNSSMEKPLQKGVITNISVILKYD